MTSTAIEDFLAGMPLAWVIAVGLLAIFIGAGYSVAIHWRARRSRNLDLEISRGQAQMQAIVEAVAAPVLIFKADLSSLLYANFRARATLGAVAGGASLDDLYRAFTDSVEIDTFRAILGPDLRVYDHDLTMSGARGGRERHFTLAAETVEFDRQPAVTLVLHDLSRHIRIETELRDSQQSLARAQAIARTGNWTLDLRLGALSCSDQVFRILGRDAGLAVTTYDRILSYSTPTTVPRSNGPYAPPPSRPFPSTSTTG